VDGTRTCSRDATGVARLELETGHAGKTERSEGLGGCLGRLSQLPHTCRLMIALWSTPVKRLALELGLSDVGLAKVCRRANITVPPRGYWARLAFGKAVQRFCSSKPDIEHRGGLARLNAYQHPTRLDGTHSSRASVTCL
jgi:hypothetical protein